MGPSKPKPAYEYELITVEQQALSDVMAAPTEFLVAHGDDGPAWERAELFYNKYAGKARVIATEKGISLVSDMTNKNAAQKGSVSFVYEVSKTFVNEGYLYKVRCVPLVHSSQSLSVALRNAKNLARFIRAGELQVSLLVR